MKSILLYNIFIRTYFKSLIRACHIIITLFLCYYCIILLLSHFLCYLIIFSITLLLDYIKTHLEINQNKFSYFRQNPVKVEVVVCSPKINNTFSRRFTLLSLIDLVIIFFPSCCHLTAVPKAPRLYSSSSQSFLSQVEISEHNWGRLHSSFYHSLEK